MQSRSELALIVGAGSGLSASLARKCAAGGMRVALAARHVGKLDALAAETHARAIACDAADPAQVEALFAAIDAPDLVVYNPSYRVRGPFLDLDRAEVLKTLIVTAHGGFLVAQAALGRMVERGRGALFFTGASASVKGYAESAPFAMGKFALRGLAQSLAREFGPKNIHVAHFVIDGGIVDRLHAAASCGRSQPVDRAVAGDRDQPGDRARPRRIEARGLAPNCQ
ncbi:MAG TPA: SDR family NAD(P)-dependent oxidoreductase, partial [Burkholderiales bacterium]|nr:SDR family NAD(P)-dependent oxidoreductase [Burkholderiales bacterium]